MAVKLVLKYANAEPVKPIHGFHEVPGTEPLSIHELPPSNPFKYGGYAPATSPGYLGYVHYYTASG